MDRLLALLLAATLGATLGCQGANTASTSDAAARATGPQKIDGPKARELVTAGARLIDVRTPQEFGGGHIEGAKNIPVDDLADNLADISKDGGPVVIYCRSGRRSDIAAHILTKAGYTDVYDLGGINNW